MDSWNQDLQSLSPFGLLLRLGWAGLFCMKNAIKKIIIGCSRAGSLTNMVPISETSAMWGECLELGINRFDTANIYAQGDSERALAAFRKKHSDSQIIITTKVGFSHGQMSTLVRALKPIISPLVTWRAHGTRQALRARAKVEKQDFSQKQLLLDAASSKKRLQVSILDSLLLHDPKVEDLLSDEIKLFLDSALERKICRRVGVSVNTHDELQAASSLNAVSEVQLPLSLRSKIESGELVNNLLAKQVKFSVRQIGQHESYKISPFEETLPRLLSDHRVDGVLLGLSSRTSFQKLMKVLN